MTKSVKPQISEFMEGLERQNPGNLTFSKVTDAMKAFGIL
jgi:threonine dehydratase